MGKSIKQPDPKYAVTHSLSGEIILNRINIENFEDPLYNTKIIKSHKCPK